MANPNQSENMSDEINKNSVSTNDSTNINEIALNNENETSKLVIVKDSSPREAEPLEENLENEEVANDDDSCSQGSQQADYTEDFDDEDYDEDENIFQDTELVEYPHYSESNIHVSNENDRSSHLVEIGEVSTQGSLHGTPNYSSYHVQQEQSNSSQHYRTQTPHATFQPKQAQFSKTNNSLRVSKIPARIFTNHPKSLGTNFQKDFQRPQSSPRQDDMSNPSSAVCCYEDCVEPNCIYCRPSEQHNNNNVLPPLRYFQQQQGFESPEPPRNHASSNQHFIITKEGQRALLQGVPSVSYGKKRFPHTIRPNRVLHNHLEQVQPKQQRLKFIKLPPLVKSKGKLNLQQNYSNHIDDAWDSIQPQYEEDYQEQQEEDEDEMQEQFNDVKRSNNKFKTSETAVSRLTLQVKRCGGGRGGGPLLARLSTSKMKLKHHFSTFTTTTTNRLPPINKTQQHQLHHQTFIPSGVVQQRLSSAKKVQIKDLKSQITYLDGIIDELRAENRTLKTVHQRQDIALKKYEGTESDLPTMIRKHKSEVHYLQLSLRKSYGSCRDYEDKIKFLDSKIIKLENTNDRLKQLVQERNLEERHKLTTQVQCLTQHVEALENRLMEYEKHIDMLEKNHFHEIEVEHGKLRCSNKKVVDARKEIGRLSEIVKQKDRIISYLQMRCGRDMNFEPPMVKKMYTQVGQAEADEELDESGGYIIYSDDMQEEEIDPEIFSQMTQNFRNIKEKQKNLVSGEMSQLHQHHHDQSHIQEKNYIENCYGPQGRHHHQPHQESKLGKNIKANVSKPKHSQQQTVKLTQVKKNPSKTNLVVNKTKNNNNFTKPKANLQQHKTTSFGESSPAKNRNSPATNSNASSLASLPLVAEGGFNTTRRNDLEMELSYQDDLDITDDDDDDDEYIDDKSNAEVETQNLNNNHKYEDRYQRLYEPNYNHPASEEQEVENDVYFSLDDSAGFHSPRKSLYLEAIDSSCNVSSLSEKNSGRRAQLNSGDSSSSIVMASHNHRHNSVLNCETCTKELENIPYIKVSSMNKTKTDTVSSAPCPTSSVIEKDKLTVRRNKSVSSKDSQLQTTNTYLVEFHSQTKITSGNHQSDSKSQAVDRRNNEKKNMVDKILPEKIDSTTKLNKNEALNSDATMKTEGEEFPNADLPLSLKEIPNNSEEIHGSNNSSEKLCKLDHEEEKINQAQEVHEKSKKSRYLLSDEEAAFESVIKSTIGSVPKSEHLENFSSSGYLQKIEKNKISPEDNNLSDSDTTLDEADDDEDEVEVTKLLEGAKKMNNTPTSSPLLKISVNNQKTKTEVISTTKPRSKAENEPTKAITLTPTKSDDDEAVMARILENLKRREAKKQESMSLETDNKPGTSTSIDYFKDNLSILEKKPPVDDKSIAQHQQDKVKTVVEDNFDVHKIFQDLTKPDFMYKKLTDDSTSKQGEDEILGKPVFDLAKILLNPNPNSKISNSTNRKPTVQKVDQKVLSGIGRLSSTLLTNANQQFQQMQNNKVPKTNNTKLSSTRSTTTLTSLKRVPPTTLPLSKSKTLHQGPYRKDSHTNLQHGKEWK